MTEAELKQYVKRIARMNGWAWHESTQNRIVRPIKGQANGFPDMFLVRDGVLLFFELKTDDGFQSEDQYRWQVLLGSLYHIIRPKHVDNRLVELLAPH